jgi:hypothetical protein
VRTGTVTPPDRQRMIVETIVTSVGPGGVVNFAPMGVEWDEQTVVLKPFVETTTFRNLLATRTAVVNITDDVRLIAQAAIADPIFPTVAAAIIDGRVLADVCTWREVRVTHVDSTPPRARIETETVYSGTKRAFIGYCRAQHAVIEAAIYATRLHFLDAAFLTRELARLQVIVNKTGGERELDAMASLATFITRGAGSGPGDSLP